MKSLSELLPILTGYTLFGTADQIVTSIENDSRKCTLNSMFVAIKGSSTDGHSYIDTAIEHGARTIVCEKLPEHLNAECSFVHTRNARECCAFLAHAFYDFPSQSLRIVGVTGTNGKTTITFLLKQILEHLGESVGLIGTTGNYIGSNYYPTYYTTPEAPELVRLLSLMKNSGVTTVVMEVSSHSLIMNRVLGVNFSAAIFTNLTHDHLDYHGTMENYADAKKILFDALAPGATAIFNSDSPFTSYLSSDTKAAKVLVGHAENVDYRVTSEIVTEQGSTFSVNTTRFSTPLLGRFNIDNCSECVAYLLQSGYSPTSINEAVSAATGAPGRMESYYLKQGATAIIDYAHTPDALKNALISCKEMLSSTGKLVVVFGCGGDRDKQKRAEMGRIAEEYADIIYLTNDNPRFEAPENIIEDILTGIKRTDSIHCIPNRATAIGTAISHSAQHDIILIAGKGHENYQIVRGERTYCSDKDEVKKYIR